MTSFAVKDGLNAKMCPCNGRFELMGDNNVL